MSEKARIKIAAAVTALFLAGISVAGLAAHDDRPHPATSATAPSIAAPAPTAAAVDQSRGDEGERYAEIEDDE